MAIDPADLRKWGSRGARRSSVTAAASPAPVFQGIASPTFQGAPPALPAAPPGYQYVIHQGVPMLAPIAGYGQGGPSAAPFAPQQAFPPGSNVVPIGSRKSKGARLVRPLSKDGVIIPDPYDVMMDGLPELKTGAVAPVYFEALAPDGVEALPSEHHAPENPFGGKPLRTAVPNLTSEK